VFTIQFVFVNEVLWQHMILSDHNQGALFLAEVMLQCSQFNLYLRTRCCDSISVNNYTIKYIVVKVFYAKLYVHSLVDELK